MRIARPQPRRPASLLATPLLAVLIALATIVPAPAAGATTWTRNLWTSKAFLYQDPYYTACTAASTMMMLNMISYRGTGGNGFAWTPYRVRRNSDSGDKRDMTSILAFSRRNDTLRSTSAGSDAHGWRNALNRYGWGLEAMTDETRRPYDDRAYKTFSGAVKAAVRAIARRGMPVGVLGWAGGHAQVMHGYVVTGEDPRISSDFTVQYVYLSDPLKKNSVVNRKTSYEALRTGSLRYRFQRYRETDSPYDDPHTIGTKRSSVKPTTAPSEWYGRYVLVLPIRQGLPDEPPPPEPTPSPLPPPDAPSAEPTAQPSAAAPSDDPTADPSVSAPSEQPTAGPSDEPTAEPAPEAPSETPTAEPTSNATEAPSSAATPDTPSVEAALVRLTRPAVRPARPCGRSRRNARAGRPTSRSRPVTSGGHCGPFGRSCRAPMGRTLCPWLQPSDRTCASRPPASRASPELSYARASSRASDSVRSSGASRPSSASRAGSGMPPAASRSRPKGRPTRWTRLRAASARTHRPVHASSG